jgi:hypothetical protein
LQCSIPSYLASFGLLPDDTALAARPLLSLDQADLDWMHDLEIENQDDNLKFAEQV